MTTILNETDVDLGEIVFVNYQLGRTVSYGNSKVVAYPVDGNIALVRFPLAANERKRHYFLGPPKPVYLRLPEVVIEKGDSRYNLILSELFA
jgi:hypothetical protein